MPRGLIVTNGVTPENFLGMPEAIGMLMLVLLHRLHESERLLRENAGRPQQIFARMVRGRAIGLIDSGRIGPGDRATVGVRAGTDPAQILVHDPFLIPDTAPTGVGLVKRAELLAMCDVGEPACPVERADTRSDLRGRTAHDEAGCGVNQHLARGFIDEDALVRVMTAGHLAGARLGVTETEPPTTRCAASTG